MDTYVSLLHLALGLAFSLPIVVGHFDFWPVAPLPVTGKRASAGFQARAASTAAHTPTNSSSTGVKVLVSSLILTFYHRGGPANIPLPQYPWIFCLKHDHHFILPRLQLSLISHSEPEQWNSTRASVTFGNLSFGNLRENPLREGSCRVQDTGPGSETYRACLT